MTHTTKARTVPPHIKDAANAAALRAQAIADGRVENPVAAAKLLRDTADTIVRWTQAEEG